MSNKTFPVSNPQLDVLAEVLASIKGATEENFGELSMSLDETKSGLAAMALNGYRVTSQVDLPSAEELIQKGANMLELLEALVDGLDVSLFADAVKQNLDVAAFSAMLAQRIDSMDEVNTMLAAYLASPDTVSISHCPLVSAFDRLHREGGFCNHG